MRGESRLELATLRDTPAIAAMSRDLIEAGLGWSWTPARVRRALAAADTNVVVARTARRLAGFGIMRYRLWTAHLDLLAVAPDCRRRGLGRRLVAWLEDVAEVAGVVNVYVEARAAWPATLAFYRHLGYAEVARLRGYYWGREDAVRLARALRTPLAPVGTPWPLASPPAGAAGRRD